MDLHPNQILIIYNGYILDPILFQVQVPFIEHLFFFKNVPYCCISEWHFKDLSKNPRCFSPLPLWYELCKALEEVLTSLLWQFTLYMLNLLVLYMYHGVHCSAVSENTLGIFSPSWFTYISSYIQMWWLGRFCEKYTASTMRLEIRKFTIICNSDYAIEFFFVRAWV